MWLLPALVLVLAVGLSASLGLYLARVLDRAGPRNALERRLDTGPQDWKQYCFSLLAFNVVAFVVGFTLLSLQPLLPLNPDGRGMLAPTTVFNTAASFLTNTNLMLYEFSSSVANNGSGFEGLGDTVGFADVAGNSDKFYPGCWDIATGLVMLLSRFVPIIAPLAFAASLAAKKQTPFTAGTLRTDTLTFGFVLVGVIVLIGALLFLPVAALGPIAEHLGPIPFSVHE